MSSNDLDSSGTYSANSEAGDKRVKPHSVVGVNDHIHVYDKHVAKGPKQGTHGPKREYLERQVVMRRRLKKVFSMRDGKHHYKEVDPDWKGGGDALQDNAWKLTHTRPVEEAGKTKRYDANNARRFQPFMQADSIFGDVEPFLTDDQVEKNLFERPHLRPIAKDEDRFYDDQKRDIQRLKKARIEIPEFEDETEAWRYDPRLGHLEGVMPEDSHSARIQRLQHLQRSLTVQKEPGEEYTTQGAAAVPNSPLYRPESDLSQIKEDTVSSKSCSIVAATFASKTTHSSKEWETYAGSTDVAGITMYSYPDVLFPRIPDKNAGTLSLDVKSPMRYIWTKNQAYVYCTYASLFKGATDFKDAASFTLFETNAFPLISFRNDKIKELALPPADKLAVKRIANLSNLDRRPKVLHLQHLFELKMGRTDDEGTTATRINDDRKEAHLICISPPSTGGKAEDLTAFTFLFLRNITKSFTDYVRWCISHRGASDGCAINTRDFDTPHKDLLLPQTLPHYAFAIQALAALTASTHLPVNLMLRYHSSDPKIRAMAENTSLIHHLRDLARWNRDTGHADREVTERFLQLIEPTKSKSFEDYEGSEKVAIDAAYSVVPCVLMLKACPLSSDEDIEVLLNECIHDLEQYDPRTLQYTRTDNVAALRRFVDSVIGESRSASYLLKVLPTLYERPLYGQRGADDWIFEESGEETPGARLMQGRTKSWKLWNRLRRQHLRKDLSKKHAETSLERMERMRTELRLRGVVIACQCARKSVVELGRRLLDMAKPFGISHTQTLEEAFWYGGARSDKTSATTVRCNDIIRMRFGLAPTDYGEGAQTPTPLSLTVRWPPPPDEWYTGYSRGVEYLRQVSLGPDSPLYFFDADLQITQISPGTSAANSRVRRWAYFFSKCTNIGDLSASDKTEWRLKAATAVGLHAEAVCISLCRYIIAASNLHDGTREAAFVENAQHSSKMLAGAYITAVQAKAVKEYTRALKDETLLIPFPHIKFDTKSELTLTDSYSNLPVDALHVASTAFAADFIAKHGLKTPNPRHARDTWLEYGTSLKAQAIRTIMEMELPSNIESVRTLNPLACHSGTLRGILCAEYPIFFRKVIPQIGSSVLAWRAQCRYYKGLERGLGEDDDTSLDASVNLARRKFSGDADSRLTQSMQLWLGGIEFITGLSGQGKSHFLMSFIAVYTPLLEKAGAEVQRTPLDIKTGQDAVADVAASLPHGDAPEHLHVASTQVISTCVSILAGIASDSQLVLA